MSAEDVSRALRHPVTWLLALVSSVFGSLGWLGSLWEPIAGTAGTWFPALATAAATVAPNLPNVLEGTASASTTVLALGGSVFVVIQLDRLYTKLQEKYL